MDSVIESMLNRFTSKDGMLFPSEPFLSSFGGRNVRVATDGDTILMADDHSGDVGASPPENVAFIMTACSGPSTHSAERQSVSEWAGHEFRAGCPRCGGGGSMPGKMTCNRCKGCGYLICNLDHEHACHVCGGIGKKDRTCRECGGSGSVNNSVVLIGVPSLSIAIDAHLVGGVFLSLPGSVIGIHLARTIGSKWCVFTGAGWMLAVPAKTSRCKGTIRNLSVEPIVTTMQSEG